MKNVKVKMERCESDEYLLSSCGRAREWPIEKHESSLTDDLDAIRESILPDLQAIRDDLREELILMETLTPDELEK